jgi:hypothetical protein
VYIDTFRVGDLCKQLYLLNLQPNSNLSLTRSHLPCFAPPPERVAAPQFAPRCQPGSPRQDPDPQSRRCSRPIGQARHGGTPTRRRAHTQTHRRTTTLRCAAMIAMRRVARNWPTGLPASARLQDSTGAHRWSEKLFFFHMILYKSCLNLNFWENAHIVWYYWCANFWKLQSVICKTISISSAVAYTYDILTLQTFVFWVHVDLRDCPLWLGGLLAHHVDLPCFPSNKSQHRPIGELSRTREACTMIVVLSSIVHCMASLSCLPGLSRSKKANKQWEALRMRCCKVVETLAIPTKFGSFTSSRFKSSGQCINLLPFDNAAMGVERAPCVWLKLNRRHVHISPGANPDQHAWSGEPG